MAVKDGDLKTDSKVEDNHEKPVKNTGIKRQANTRSQSRKIIKKSQQNEMDKDKEINDRYQRMNVDQELPVYLL